MLTAARSYLFTGFMIVLTVVMGVLFLPVIAFGEQSARTIVKIWAKIVLGALRLVCGVTCQVEEAARMPATGAIVAANHQSMWETVALYALLPRPVMVFKKELLKIPIYGLWARSTGITVDRDGGPASIRLLRRQARERIARNEQIVIFPEGTRGKPGGLGPLMPGVAGMYLAAEAPVTPVIHNSGEYWRHPGVLKTPGAVTLRFLPAIPVGLPRRQFMGALEEALAGNAALSGKTRP